eukprot:6417175-Prymnesium_polylepis.1
MTSFSFFTVTEICLPARLPSERASATSRSQLNISASSHPSASSFEIVRSGRSGLQHSSARRWSNALLIAWIARASASLMVSQATGPMPESHITLPASQNFATTRFCMSATAGGGTAP